MDGLGWTAGHRPTAARVAVALSLGLGLALVALVGLAPAAGAATTATLTGGRLTVTGTGGNDVIVVRAVSGSQIEVASLGSSARFPATAVRSIRVLAGAGHDSVRIDDTRLAFTVTRPTVLDGGTGNDTLRGGKGPETLRGGTGNDTATGGKGNDTVELGAGTDTSIWSVGSGTDVVEGGTETDTQRAVGTAGADSFAVAAEGARVRVGVGPGAARTRTVEAVEVTAGNGNDTIGAGSLAGLGLTALRLDAAGGTDSVTVTGTTGADTVAVADGTVAGTRTVTGTTGPVAVAVKATEALRINGGDDSDTLTLPPLSDPVTFGGGAGTDRLVVTGTPALDSWAFAASGATLEMFDGESRRVAATAVEGLTATPGGGADGVIVPSLTATGLTDVDVDLGVNALQDGSVDRVDAVATAGPDVVQVTTVGPAVQVLNNGPQVDISHTSVTDELHLALGAGTDTGSAGALSTLIALTIEGGAGGDTINGGNGPDTLVGGDDNDTIDGNGGNDVVFLGADNDTSVWDPGDGSDITEGQAGTDTMRFNGSAGAEVFAASANGGRLLFTRNVGNIVMDVDDVEAVDLNALGGSDTITVSSLSATDVSRFDVDLGVNGLGDAALDTITVNGTAGEDLIQVTLLGSELAVRSPDLDLVVDNPELATDALTVNTSNGNDTITAGTGTNLILFTFNGGNDNDVLFGSPGNDVLNGDAGDDAIFAGDGADTINGGTNTDYADGGPGIDTASNVETSVNIP